MIKILFVCHGNICRSPMAEYVMKDLVSRAGREKEFQIASAAVSREEIGNPVYPPARRELAKHGISCEGHAARQVTMKDYHHFDRIYYMDRSNARWLERMLPKDPEKIRPLLSHDVADPWYTGDFRQTWGQLHPAQAADGTWRHRPRTGGAGSGRCWRPYSKSDRSYEAHRG